MAIKDITFKMSSTEDSTKVVYSTDAVSMAIRNILLSEEGVFVNIPDLNSDISQMLFDQISEDDLHRLKTNITRELTKRVPSLSGIVIDIRKLSVDNLNVDGATALGISILKEDTGENYDLLLFKNEGNVVII